MFEEIMTNWTLQLAVWVQNQDYIEGDFIKTKTCCLEEILE